MCKPRCCVWPAWPPPLEPLESYAGREATSLHSRFGAKLKLLVPGIRLPGSQTDDQSRTVTPAEAVAAGASYIILGRTVTAAADPVAAMRQVLTTVNASTAQC